MLSIVLYTTNAEWWIDKLGASKSPILPKISQTFRDYSMPFSVLSLGQTNPDSPTRSSRIISLNVTLFLANHKVSLLHSYPLSFIAYALDQDSWSANGVGALTFQLPPSNRTVLGGSYHSYVSHAMYISVGKQFLLIEI